MKRVTVGITANSHKTTYENMISLYKIWPHCNPTHATQMAGKYETYSEVYEPIDFKGKCLVA